jgi:hypothetical protein
MAMRLLFSPPEFDFKQRGAMNSKDKAILTLRIICGIAIAIGLAGTITSIITHDSVPLFWVSVPGWAIGASATYMGIRYWRRIPELEKGLKENGSFSWANFRKQS